MRRIALLIAVGFVVVLSSAAALAVQGDRAGQADQMDSCLAKHGWPYGLDALRVIERRVGHPNGLVRICEREISNEMHQALAKRPSLTPTSAGVKAASLRLVLLAETREQEDEVHSASRRYSLNGGIPADVKRALRSLGLVDDRR